MAGEHAQVGNVTYRALFPVYRGKKTFPLFNCKGNHTGNFKVIFFCAGHASLSFFFYLMESQVTLDGVSGEKDFTVAR